MFPNCPPSIKPTALKSSTVWWIVSHQSPHISFIQQWWQGRIILYVYSYCWGKPLFHLDLLRIVFISFRLCVAALHFNENGQRHQAVTKDGDLQWKLSYPKRNKGEHAVVKPCKTSITYGMYRMVWLTFLLVICYTWKRNSKIKVTYFIISIINMWRWCKSVITFIFKKQISLNIKCYNVYTHFICQNYEKKLSLSFRLCWHLEAESG